MNRGESEGCRDGAGEDMWDWTYSVILRFSLILGMNLHPVQIFCSPFCVDIPLQSYISSVQFSRSAVSDSLWPHGLQHARSPCSSPTPGVYSNSCPLSQWCHPAISSSVVPFSCLSHTYIHTCMHMQSYIYMVILGRWNNLYLSIGVS